MLKTEFGVHVELTDDEGPPRVQQAGQIPEVESTSGESFSAKLDPGNPQPVTFLVTAPTATQLRFCTIDANHFEYDDCGEPASGILLTLKEPEKPKAKAAATAPEPIPINVSQVYINRPGQGLESFKAFDITVKKELLVEHRDVVVTVTYGIKE